jgi:uncharacterized protein YbjT (DUF2867 family)
MYVITGATGNTGSVVADKLLAHGQKVRVVGRDARRMERFSGKGAEAFIADVSDVAALTKAFSEAKAVYVLIPPHLSSPDVRSYQERVSDAVAAAIERNSVPHAVVLSSIGADKKDRTGPVVGLHNLEEKLHRISDLNALIFRAGYLMENLLPQVGIIEIISAIGAGGMGEVYRAPDMRLNREVAAQSLGFLTGPIRADLPLPMIATRDIGAAAADALLRLDFQGKSTRELQGPRDVTYGEVADHIGKAIGKPGLGHQQLSAAQLKPVLMQMGMSASMADLVLEMSDALNSGYMKALEPRSPANTTPTTLETFLADRFLPAFRGKAARA